MPVFVVAKFGVEIRHKYLIFALPILLAMFFGCSTPESTYFQNLRSGDYSSIKKALASDLDPNLKDAEGKTALIWLASLDDQTSEMDTLIEKGADVNLKDNKGWTALIHAAYNSRHENVDFLLKHGAKVNAKTPDGQNAFSLAYKNPQVRSTWFSKEGMPRILDSLINAGIDPSVLDEDGNPALLVAVKNNWHLLVDLLIKNGADVNCQNAKGMTPLMAASYATFGDSTLDSVKILIKHGASVNEESKEGLNALFYANTWGHRKIVKLLEKHGAKVPLNMKPAYAAIYAASNGDIAKVEKLLASGVNIDAKIEDGMTMLLSAVFNHNETMLSFLLKGGADPNAAFSKFQISPLSLACHYKNAALVKILLENKANPNIADMRGYTPLIIASLSENSELVRLLIKHGARVNYMNENGLCSLSVATGRLNLKVMELLLENGADPNVIYSDIYCRPEYDGLNITLLMWACGDFHPFFPELVELLLKYGADPNKTNPYGFTPLMCAVCYSGYSTKKNDRGESVPDLSDKKKVIKMLLDKGADINHQDSEGMTALMLCAQREIAGMPEIIRYLIDNSEGIDIDAQDKDGDTALILAVKEGGLDNIKVLLEYGAGLDIRNDLDETAFTVKLQEGVRKVEIKEILRSDTDELLKKYAERGNSESECLLGKYYIYGDEKNRDVQKGETLLLKAASKGNLQAEMSLGYFYYNKKKYPEALRWFKAAASKGDIQAEKSLGHFYYEKKQYPEALRWFKAAASQGDRKAKLVIADFYYRGLGVEADLSEAKKRFVQIAKGDWQNKANELGYSFRRVLEAFMFIDGNIHIGMPESEEGFYLEVEKRLKIFRKLFGNDHESADFDCFYLAENFLKQKKYSKADDLFKDILGITKWRFYWPGSLFGRGKCAEAQGNFKKASAFYEKVILKYADDCEYLSKAYLGQLRCLVKLGEKKKATELFKTMNADKTIDDFPEKKIARELMRIDND